MVYVGDFKMGGPVEAVDDKATDIDKEHLNKNREGYYGWFGLGGSLMQWHPGNLSPFLRIS